jgi:acyl-coenzyme A synthetase/AMP-(fatty) acid ligase
MVRSAPVLVYGSPSAPVAVDRDGERSAARFMAEAAALAAELPEGAHVANLCTDRYRFTLGFVAALLRKQVTLLPSSDAPGPLLDLARQHEGTYCLHDQPFAYPGLRTHAFPARLDAAPAVPGAVIPADQPAAIFFTSGSTGLPMPHGRSWGALVASTRAAARALGLDGLAGGHVFGTVPHQHSYGFESIVMLALQHGFAFNNARPLLPADIVRQLDALPAPRILVTTPVHLRSLVAHDGPLPRVHRIVSATAPLAPELALRAEERFQAPLFEIFGCSEVGQMAVRRTVETLEWSCLDGIVLEERAGEVWASGPAAAAEAALNDVIELRGPDRFLLHGRKSDVVNIAGKRSSLSYLNHQLNAIDGVEDGVFLMPEAAEGSLARLTAYVVAPGLTAAEILAALRPRIDAAFLPRPIHFVDHLPRNALGKLSRQAAEALALSHVEE